MTGDEYLFNLDNLDGINLLEYSPTSIKPTNKEMVEFEKKNSAGYYMNDYFVDKNGNPIYPSTYTNYAHEAHLNKENFKLLAPSYNSLGHGSTSAFLLDEKYETNKNGERASNYTGGSVILGNSTYTSDLAMLFDRDLMDAGDINGDGLAVELMKKDRILLSGNVVDFLSTSELPLSAIEGRGWGSEKRKTHVAIGGAFIDDDDGGIAIGNKATAVDGGIALGENAYTGSGGHGGVALSIGHGAASFLGTAIGVGATSFEEGSSTFGMDAITGVGATYATALGTGSLVAKDAKNSVALGAFSVAEKENVVSVGNSEYKRKIVNVADGEISENSTDAINGSQLYFVANNLNNTLNEVKQDVVKGISVKTEDDVTSKHQLGDTISIWGDGENIVTETKDGNVHVKLTDNIKTKSIKTGTITISEEGVDLGGKTIKNMGRGEITPNSLDVVIGSQLHETNLKVNKLDDKINRLDEHVLNVDKKITAMDNKVKKVDKKRKAGTASAVATASLLQAYKPGQSSVTAAVGQHQSQSALAVGYSRIAEGGKMGVKLSFNTNTSGEVGGGVGLGYFW